MNREKNRRIGRLGLQLETAEDELNDLEDDLTSFTQEFNFDMDSQANRAGYEGFKERFEAIQSERSKDTNFLRNSKFVYPTFETVATDIEDIMDYGRIVDNCEYCKPLIVMNTFNFKLLEYRQSNKSFEEVPIKGKIFPNKRLNFDCLDDDNLISTVPKYFKSVVISSDEIVLLGGYDYEISNSSKKVFYIIN